MCPRKSPRDGGRTTPGRREKAAGARDEGGGHSKEYQGPVRGPPVDMSDRD